jgi:hypothetical protein
MVPNAHTWLHGENTSDDQEVYLREQEIYAKYTHHVRVEIVENDDVDAR